ncbi:MAG: DUF2510 domain-containing protein [Actinobacteria bacterium]|nr:DUF2510 domain-containing protein [Actinomycetota bacterium]
MSNPMPGWYPDPESPGRQRFWDGQQWTEARAYPASEMGASQPSKSSGSGSGPWPWIVALLIIAIVILLAAWLISSLTSGEKGDRTSTPVPTPTAPTVTTTQTETVTPTPPTTQPTSP